MTFEEIRADVEAAKKKGLTHLWAFCPETVEALLDHIQNEKGKIMAEISIVVERSGKVSVFIQQGTFAEGKEKIEQLLKDLQLEGVEFSVVGDVEKHAHEKPHVHQKEQERNR